VKIPSVRVDALQIPWEFDRAISEFNAKLLDFAQANTMACVDFISEIDTCKRADGGF
jgi:hypothetical protein